MDSFMNQDRELEAFYSMQNQGKEAERKVHYYFVASSALACFLG